MKITTLALTRMHNAEHFQFMTEVKNLLAQHSMLLNGTKLIVQFVACYSNEDKALKKIVKSAKTEQLEAADQLRDSLFRGLADSVTAALNHFDPQTVAAAKRLKIVFDTYGNLAATSMNKETAGIYNLLQELTGNYAPDMEKLALTAWIPKLTAANKAFETVLKERIGNTAAATQLTMKECRAETDSMYNAIVERINALIVVNGEAAYTEAVSTLNAYIDMYSNTMVQRQGRADAKQKQQETNNEE